MAFTRGEEGEEGKGREEPAGRGTGQRCTFGLRRRSRESQKSLSGEPWVPLAREPATASLATAVPLRQKSLSGVLPRKLLPGETRMGVGVGALEGTEEGTLSTP